MKYLCDIGFITGTEGFKKWRKCGALFLDEDKDRCAIMINAFHQGPLVGKPKDGKGPFLQGDVVKKIGTYEKDGEEKNSYQWCGFITTDDEEGVRYTVVLEAYPIVYVGDEKNGIFLSVFSDDTSKEEPSKKKFKSKPKQEEPNGSNDDDKLPF